MILFTSTCNDTVYSCCDFPLPQEPCLPPVTPPTSCLPWSFQRTSYRSTGSRGAWPCCVPSTTNSGPAVCWGLVCSCVCSDNQGDVGSEELGVISCHQGCALSGGSFSLMSRYIYSLIATLNLGRNKISVIEKYLFCLQNIPSNFTTCIIFSMFMNFWLKSIFVCWINLW